MMKNVIDCLTGGISYWAVGHGLCVGAVRRNIFISCRISVKMIILLILAFVLMMFARNTGTTLFSAGAISL